MAIPVGKLRTPAMARRHARLGGFHPSNACELCRKVIKDGREIMVAIDHESYEFVTEAEAQARGDSVSCFPVGPDCARLIRKALES